MKKITRKEALKQGFTIDTRMSPSIGYKGPRFNPEDMVEIEEPTVDKLSYYTIAAFISAGMHTDIEALDKAKDDAGTGCLELVMAALGYVDYIEALFKAGEEVIGNIPGVMEYEVCEPFGYWIVEIMLARAAANEGEDTMLPNHELACLNLRQRMHMFYVRSIVVTEESANVLAALEAVPLPEAPAL